MRVLRLFVIPWIEAESVGTRQVEGTVVRCVMGYSCWSEVVVPRMEYRVLRVAEINWLEIGTNERQIANFSGSEIGFLANANAPRGAVGLSLCELGPSLLVLLYV